MMDEGLPMPNWYFELKEAAAVVILSRTGGSVHSLIVTSYSRILYLMYEVARQLFLF